MWKNFMSSTKNHANFEGIYRYHQIEKLELKNYHTTKQNRIFIITFL